MIIHVNILTPLLLVVVVVEEQRGHLALAWIIKAHFYKIIVSLHERGNRDLENMFDVRLYLTFRTSLFYVHPFATLLCAFLSLLRQSRQAVKNTIQNTSPLLDSRKCQPWMKSLTNLTLNEKLITAQSGCGYTRYD